METRLKTVIADDDIRIQRIIRDSYPDEEIVFINKKDLNNHTVFAVSKVLVVLPNIEIKKISKDLYELGIFDVSIYPIDLFESEFRKEFVIDINNINPRLDRLEIEITPQCNLKCKGCSHYCNLTTENDITDFDKFKESLVQLKRFFWGVHLLRLMGGEPLTNPNFLDFVRAAREEFPDANIHLVSNGLLIHKLTPDQLKEIKKNRCGFSISYYPPVKRKLKNIKRILEESGIEYNISPQMNFFFKTLMEEPHSSPKESFEQCMFSQCHSMLDGQLSICGLSLYSYRFNRQFGLNLPTEDKIDLFSTNMDGWDIEKTFHTPHEMCKYCHTAMVPFKWTTRSKVAAIKEDYLVERNTLNMVILPNVQKLMKPLLRTMYAAYGKLRHY